MTILGVIAWFVCGLLFAVLIPGVCRRSAGMDRYLILSGIGASVPFGPWNMGVVWVVFRGWGVAITRPPPASRCTASSARSAGSRCR